MKRFLFLAVLSFCCASISAQTPDSLKSGVPTVVSVPDSSTVEHSQKQDEIFTFAEVLPTFPGEQGFQKYLDDNLQFPLQEKENGIQGVVYIGFVVEKDGSISNIKILKEVQNAPGFSKEAIRLISAMPKWNPAKLNGKIIRVQLKQAIRFTLPNH